MALYLLLRLPDAYHLRFEHRQRGADITDGQSYA
jgi:hypothetical protein